MNDSVVNAMITGQKEDSLIYETKVLKKIQLSITGPSANCWLCVILKPLQEYSALSDSVGPEC